MDFAISNPIVVTRFILALLPTHPQIMLRDGRESRPRHQKRTNSWISFSSLPTTRSSRSVAEKSTPPALPLDKQKGVQASQFTSAAFTGALAKAGVAISMDGRGRWMDNVFIERLWRSLKYEDVYLKGYDDGREAARGIAQWVAFYNNRRPHQALAGRTPMAVWREAIAGAKAADMMDNAFALPTCPQPQKLTQPLAG